MKAMTINFCVLSALLCLMSCSAEKKSVSLKVSTVMGLSGDGFTGGLVVTGKSSTGKSFSATTQSGQQVNVLLDNGSWEMSVAGWDGAAPFAGDVYCGKSSVILDSNTSSIQLSAKKENCLSADFHEGDTNLLNATQTGYKPLSVINCSSLYLSSTSYLPVVKETPNSSLQTGFCNTSPQLPSSVFKKAKAGKLIIEGSNGNLSSSCISSPNSTINFNHKIPAGKIPVKVQLFNNDSCAGEAIEFKFDSGLLAGSDKFDSIINSTTASNGNYSLILPYNEVRRGYSALMNHMPSLKCNGTDCIPAPGSIPADYFVYESTTYNHIPLPISSCAGVTFNAGNYVSFESGKTCFEEDDRVYTSIKLELTQCVTTNCSFSYTINGNEMTKTVTTNYDHNSEREVYSSVWRLFGTSQQTYFFDNQQKDHSQGVAGNIAEEFAGGGPISLFGNVSCQNLVGKNEITLFEDGAYKTYQVEAYNSSTPIPKLLCMNQNPNTTACSASPTFDKKIVMRQLHGQIWKAQRILEVDCDSKVGMVEEQQEKEDHPGTRLENNFIAWNTAESMYARLEALNYEQLKIEGTVVHEYSSFNRAEKRGENHITGAIFDWNSTLYSNNGINQYNDHLSHRDFVTFYEAGDTIMDFQKSYSYTSTQPGTIFDLPYHSKEIDMPYLTHDSFSAQSPDGSKKLRLWTEGPMSPKLWMSTFDGSWTNHSTPESVSVGPSPRAAVDNNGTIVMAYPETVGDTKIVIKTRIGNNWQTPTLALGGDLIQPIGGIDVCLEGNKAAVVWSQYEGPKAKIFVAFNRDLGNETWSVPSSLSDAISGTENSFSPKCVIEGSTARLVITYLESVPSTTNYQVRGGRTWIHTTYPVTLSDYRTDNSILSGQYEGIGEVFLERSGDHAYATYYDITNDVGYVNAFSYVTNTWSTQQPSGFLDHKYEDFNQILGAAFGTASRPISIPNNQPIPYTSSVRGADNFSLRELKPAKIKAKFTPYNSFVQQ